MNLRLLGPVIAVCNLREIPKQQESLIVKPDDVRVPIGPVLADIAGVGSKCPKDIPELQTGTTVIVPNHFGTEFVFEGQKLRIYNFEDVIGIV